MYSSSQEEPEFGSSMLFTASSRKLNNKPCIESLVSVSASFLKHHEPEDNSTNCSRPSNSNSRKSFGSFSSAQMGAQLHMECQKSATYILIYALVNL